MSHPTVSFVIATYNRADVLCRTLAHLRPEAQPLAAAKSEAVVFLGSGAELVEFARAAERLSFGPALLAPARFAERVVFDLPRSFDGRTYLSYPALPSDDRGFVRTVPETRQVAGYPEIYTVGDAAD